jgi:hypothetical protein
MCAGGLEAIGQQEVASRRTSYVSSWRETAYGRCRVQLSLAGAKRTRYASSRTKYPARQRDNPCIRLRETMGFRAKRHLPNIWELRRPQHHQPSSAGLNAALAALDWLRGGRPTEKRRGNSAGATTWWSIGDQATASPSYGIDVLALALAVVLAAAIVVLASKLCPILPT